jgi:hypothetical protein
MIKDHLSSSKSCCYSAVPSKPWSCGCSNYALSFCYRHNLGRPESGPRSKIDLKDSYNGLANRTLCRCFGPRMAMYLDRYVCLNSLDRDS